MRFVLVALALLVGGCAQTRVYGYDSARSVCRELMPDGMVRLSEPPEESAELLGIAGTGPALKVLWFHDASGDVAMCNYEKDLCDSNSRVFHRTGSGWQVDQERSLYMVCI